jgi:predicted AlkP superfamily phosphohydrolase/phosphomutase
LLDSHPEAPVPLAKLKVDWSKTKAWGDGGYYSRISLNIKGREPQGIVEQNDYESLRSELIERLEAIPDENGKPMGTKVHKPEELYRVRKGVAPDLFVYFGNLAWRSAGTVGRDSIYTFENDTGPDDANHGKNGIFIARPASSSANGGTLEGLKIQDIAPTVLDLFGIPIPSEMEGQVIRLT